jgi:hypothetical protein
MTRADNVGHSLSMRIEWPIMRATATLPAPDDAL